MAYAHALIEYTDDDGAVVRYNRGDSVPKSTPGFDELVEEGAIKNEKYDPDAEPKLTPEFVEVDGVRYVKANDGAEAEDVRN